MIPVRPFAHRSRSPSPRYPALTRVLTSLTLATLATIISPRVIADEPPSPIYATATCAAATKPGRIRCRAVVELPLETANTRRIAWGELRIVRADAEVAPLRGRLGPLDAELRDDGRMSWAFSVTAAKEGERTMTVRFVVSLEPKGSGPATVIERDVSTAVRVVP